MSDKTVPLAEYLFTRLIQLGADSIFGLPGDYNLNLLDFVEPAGLRWVGNCNELNAGYAADGYSRIKGIGALITTFGVGELSAVNAIAGAYSERAPVVHIVGTPPRPQQDARALVHHTFKDGEFKHFDRMQEHITVAQTIIKDLRTAPAEIDRALQQCLIHSRPVRVTLPDDMVRLHVHAAGLETTVSIPPPVYQPHIEYRALSVILDRIYNSKRPMLLIDGESRGLDIMEEILSLVKITGWPTFTTGFGKGLINEDMSSVHGAFQPIHRLFTDTCDLVLCFGPHYSTSNSYYGQTIPHKKVLIDIMATEVRTNQETFRDLSAKHFLQNLIAELDLTKISKYTPDIPSPKPIALGEKSDPVLHNNGFWQRLSSFFQEGDIVLAGTGTAGYVANDFILPRHAKLFRPVTWLSIGYMLPAALGASVAQRDLISQGKYYGLTNARTVLFIGDGSFQLTAQEMSTIIHHKLNVVIFLINNSGYTIERCIHGRGQPYNDITSWRYLAAPALFGAPEHGEYAAHTWKVETFGDLEAALTDELMLNGKGLRMVEVLMDRLDAPEMLLGWLNKQIKEGR